MNEPKSSSPMSHEPERYELDESPAHHFTLDRRRFMQLFGGGIVVFLSLEDVMAGQESGGGRRRGFGAPLPTELGAWLQVGENGEVTVFTGKVEVGQNVRTSLAQAVADELRLPVESVHLVMGDTDRTPYDIGTFGSRTTPTMAPQLRKAAATARELLIDLAAERWKVERRSLVAADGEITDPTTKHSIGFGELARGKRLARTILEDVATTPPAQWRVAGTSVPKAAARQFVTGKHRFPSDLKRPEMWHGKVLRPPSYGAMLGSVDTAKASAMGDVVVVRDGDFVGVAARRESDAARALESIRADWEPKSHPSQRELFEYLKSNPIEAEGFRGNRRYTEGSVEEGLRRADRTLEASYTVAYIAHAPLEPRAAVAEWAEGKLTVWTGTQRPFGVRSELIESFHLPEGQVRVLVPDTGSAYGGKHTGECAIEAARLAKAAGRPVKLVWTREEEFRWAYFRPAGVIEVKSGVMRDGTITSWEFHNYNSGASAIRGLYDIPHQIVEFHASRSPLRQGSYRGLAATANHFARESHIDELAHAVGMDPLAFRRKNLKDERLVAALDAAADRFGWERARSSKDKGFGIAGGFEKGGYVATCAEVTIERPGGRIKIDRLVTAFDCGAVVNPDGLKNQIEGAVIMGIGGALFEAVEFEDGMMTNPRFSQYRVPRFSDLPAMETILLDRHDVPSAGAGETPIVGIAPAVANAVFSATGVRLRSLPMAPAAVSEA